MKKKDKMTYKFLVPIFRTIQDKNIKSKIQKLIMFSDDIYYTDHLGTENCILLLFNNSFINDDVSDIPYINDIVIINNITIEKPKLLVYLMLPKTYWDTWKYFSQGKYSQMFTEEQIKDIFNDEDKDVVDILHRHPRLIPNFRKQVSSLFDVPEHIDMEIKEVALPPDKDYEVFRP